MLMIDQTNLRATDLPKRNHQECIRPRERFTDYRSLRVLARPSFLPGTAIELEASIIL